MVAAQTFNKETIFTLEGDAARDFIAKRDQFGHIVHEDHSGRVQKVEFVLWKD